MQTEPTSVGDDGHAVATPTDSGAAEADVQAVEQEGNRPAVDEVDEMLDEVERAMARLDDGTYGRCETCGEPIDDAELASDPLARACTPCAKGALALGSA